MTSSKLYYPTDSEISFAAVQSARCGESSLNRKGYVSSDQVRAMLVRTTGFTIPGEEISKYLDAHYARTETNYYKVR